VLKVEAPARRHDAGVDISQDVTIEPAAWSRWLSCVIFKAKSPPNAPVRVAHSGVLFDVIEAPREPVTSAVHLLIEGKHMLGPVAAEGDDAWALVPPGVHSSWPELVRVATAPAGVTVSCRRPGSIVRLPAREPASGASVVWLVPPMLDAAGLPVLTDPIDFLDALRQCDRGRP
jgi:hypothetical protein